MSPTHASGEVGGLAVCRSLDDFLIFVIVQADPRIRISALLLRQFHEGGVPFPWNRVEVGLTCAGRCPLGDVVRIETQDRAVVYRVTEADRDAPGGACWIAEWPD